MAKKRNRITNHAASFLAVYTRYSESTTTSGKRVKPNKHHQQQQKDGIDEDDEELFRTIGAVVFERMNERVVQIYSEPKSAKDDEEEDLVGFSRTSSQSAGWEKDGIAEDDEKFFPMEDRPQRTLEPKSAKDDEEEDLAGFSRSSSQSVGWEKAKRKGKSIF